MVPTELLAIQHYHHLLNLLENMEEVVRKPSVALLTGSTPSKQSRIIREACVILYFGFCFFFFSIFFLEIPIIETVGWQGLQTGNISLVIGTHSLIAENVEFSALRVAVVDEQHRFGVIQRGRFNSKVVYFH